MAATGTIAAARCPFSPSQAQRRRLCQQSFISLSSSFAKALRLNQSPAVTSGRGSGAAATAMSMEAGIGVMGTKLGMMSFFEPEGTVVPVTVVGFREGNIVTQVKADATDGYDAVQVGYRRVRDRKLTRPELGHLSKAGAVPMRHLQEFRLQTVEGFEPGQRLVVEEIFKEGNLVDVSGTTIGKGFQEKHEIKNEEKKEIKKEDVLKKEKRRMNKKKKVSGLPSSNSESTSTSTSVGEEKRICLMVREEEECENEVESNDTIFAEDQ